MGVGKHRLLITGLPYFARRIADLVENDSWQATVQTPSAFQNVARRRLESVKLLSTMSTHDILYQVGGPTINRHLLRWCHRLNRPAILHWVGSDVLDAQSNPADLKVFAQFNNLVHWTDTIWLQKELDALGITAKFVPLCACSVRPRSSLPDGPLAVLVYLPKKRWEFYGGSQVLSIAAEMPKVRFIVVGDDGRKRSPLKNVEYLGWVSNLNAVFDQIHVLLRLPHHDGLSSMVIEALARGRMVIWNYPIEGGIIAHTAAQALEQLSLLEVKQRRKELEFNVLGKEFVENHFSEAKVAAEVRTALETLTKRSPVGAQGRNNSLQSFSVKL